jgi:hypothetical protein
VRTPSIAALILSTCLVSTPALADEPPPPPPPPPSAVELCGTPVDIRVVRDDSRFRERDRGFQVQGFLSVEVSDADSSVVLTAPGRIRVTEDRATGRRTLVLTGRNLLLPDLELERDALRAAGLPDIPLITGRVVLEETFDPATGETLTGRVVSVAGSVTDVCALLAE